MSGRKPLPLAVMMTRAITEERPKEPEPFEDELPVAPLGTRVVNATEELTYMYEKGESGRLINVTEEMKALAAENIAVLQALGIEPIIRQKIKGGKDDGV
jgi:hypothetical protein